VDALTKYYVARYGVELTDAEARRLLHNTGGIGGWVHESRSGVWTKRSAEELDLDGVYLKEPQLQAVVECIREYQFVVHGCDLAAKARAGECLLPSDVSVPYDTLVFGFTVNGRAAAWLQRSDIGRWVDMSILYVSRDADETSVVELAIPSDAVIHYASSTVHPRECRR
jgi:hypothetical protein